MNHASLVGFTITGDYSYLMPLNLYALWKFHFTPELSKSLLLKNITAFAGHQDTNKNKADNKKIAKKHIFASVIW